MLAKICSNKQIAILFAALQGEYILKVLNNQKDNFDNLSMCKERGIATIKVKGHILGSLDILTRSASKDMFGVDK
jgi:hypothetical protein